MPDNTRPTLTEARKAWLESLQTGDEVAVCTATNRPEIATLTRYPDYFSRSTSRRGYFGSRFSLASGYRAKDAWNTQDCWIEPFTPEVILAVEVAKMTAECEALMRDLATYGGRRLTSADEPTIRELHALLRRIAAQPLTSESEK